CADCGLTGMDEVRIDHLSKGFRQRVGLAQAIVHDPAILILDEPTTGLDPNQILEIRSLIRSLGANKTVILSTHILQEVEALCSELIIINEGQIVAQGTTADLARNLQGEEWLNCRLLVPEAFKLSADEAAAQLQASGSITAVSEALLEGRILKLKARAAAGSSDEAAVALFDWAAAKGCKLLELRREALSLEQIFVKLTNEESAQ
ncbi:MAG: ATP-binding cassette domain-containing protein, partial [Spirochaetes bacterium]|nr:ATP-binding cassette domain-containing protein [Spirochaetota bacterium]MBU0955501.1 ATP-binding cassette domain-containing protein [Spirochaetota bacterium]